MEDSLNPDCPFCRKLTALADLPPEEVVWEFPHSVALLGTWQYYQGYCILVSRRHATELYELEDEERRAYFEEMSLLARAIAACFQPHKLNYEALGNQVPHLHWHLFPRYMHDPERLKPVWLAVERTEHDERERLRLQSGALGRRETAERLRQRLAEMAAG